MENNTAVTKKKTTTKKAVKKAAKKTAAKDGVIADELKAKVAELKAKATKKTAAKKAPASKKKATQKQAEAALKVRLYAKGEFYFGKLAASRIGDLPYMTLEAKGKTVTLVPTKSEKDAHKLMACHASPVLRVAKVLEEIGWNGQTQDLDVKPVGETGFQFDIA